MMEQAWNFLDNNSIFGMTFSALAKLVFTLMFAKTIILVVKKNSYE